MPYIEGESLSQVLKSSSVYLKTAAKTNLETITDVVNRLRSEQCESVNDDVDSPTKEEPESEYLLDFRSSIQVLIDLLDSLSSAHDQGVIHRDIKPDNIMIRDNGQAFLIDFGVANFVAEAAEQELGSPAFKTSSTRTSRAGTWQYMAPEHLAGHASEASDIWSMGAVLFELLTQQKPFKRPVEIGKCTVAHPSTLNPRAPVELGDICLKALEIDPCQRFESAGMFAEDLKRWKRGELVHSRDYNIIESSTIWISRNRWKSVAAFFGVVALGITIWSSARLKQVNSKLVESLASQQDANQQLDKYSSISTQLVIDFSNEIRQNLTDEIGLQSKELAFLEVLSQYATKFSKPRNSLEFRVDAARIKLLAAAAYFRLNRIELALKQIDEARDLIRNDSPLVGAEVFALRGKIFARLGDSQVAIDDLETASQIVLQNPNNGSDTRYILAGIRNTLGMQFAKKGEVEKGFSILEVAIKDLEPFDLENASTSEIMTYGSLLNDFGVLHLRLQKWAEAKTVFAKAVGHYDSGLQRFPESNNYHLFLAGTMDNLAWVSDDQEKIGLRKRVVEMLLLLVKRNPESPQYRKNLLDAVSNLVTSHNDRNEIQDSFKLVSEFSPIASQLVGNYPTSISYLKTQVTLMTGHMDARFRNNQVSKALELANSIVNLWSQICAKDRENQNNRMGYAKALMNQGEVLLEANNLLDAIKALTNAKRIADTITIPMFDLHRSRLNELLNTASEQSK